MELPECPFCGSEAELMEEVLPRSLGKNVVRFGVRCTRNGCWACEHADCWEDTPEAAIERWCDRPVRAE